jgi:DNA-binding beta-propeller fold protein YncE
MQVDDKYRRLLIAHTGSRTFDVVDLGDGTVVRQVDFGEGRGIAVDERDGKYFVGASRPELIAVVQRKYIVKDNQIQMSGPIDAIAFDSRNDMLYADRADNGSVVAINGRSNKVYASIAIGGDLEYIVYDAVSDRIYQNVYSNNSIVVIDPNTNHVVSVWQAAPAVQLTGLAVDGVRHRLFSAGSNGKLAVIDAASGALIATVKIAPNVDQIAFDPGKRRLYCASGAGLLSVVQETDEGAELVADITVPRHAHTLAVDPTTHAVWISYGALDNDYVMKLIPPR